jgi:hypothetical protein
MPEILAHTIETDPSRDGTDRNTSPAAKNRRSRSPYVGGRAAVDVADLPSSSRAAAIQPVVGRLLDERDHRGESPVAPARVASRGSSAHRDFGARSGPTSSR